MDWEIQIKEYLATGKYQQLVEYCENLLENQSDSIAPYWYLGLGYLFLEESEAAETTWLLAFSQGDEEDVEKWSQDLGEILSNYAQETAKNNQLYISWLIRNQIQQIEPSNINNLLCLCQLEIDLQTYKPEILAEWQIIDYLKQTPSTDVNTDLLWELLPRLLWFPHPDTISLLNSAWSYTSNQEIAINSVYATALKIAQETTYKNDSKYLQLVYAIELLNSCLKQQPNNLTLLKDLISLNSTIHKYEEAFQLATDFYIQCETITTKVAGYYLIIHVLLKEGNWLKLESRWSEYLNLINQLIAENPQKIEPLVKDIFIYITMPLFYYRDQARENRLLQNQIAQLVQQSETKVTQTQPKIRERNNQKLKIGYIANTLRRHSVGWLSRWLIHHHNQQQFQLFIYLINQEEDDITQNWFRDKVEIVRQFSSSVNTIAQEIKADEVDILVDLDSATNGPTARIMAHKPAPIQVTWLGFDASGIPSIDYFISDAYVISDAIKNHYQERIWELPDTYIGIDGFEVGVPTLNREDLDIPNEAIIYLNVQEVKKLNPPIIRLQMQIIKAVPNSFLLFKGTGIQELIKATIIDIAESEGVSTSRLRFLGKDKNEETHRANLAIADIVLDTYPYNGATTTLEVLWMAIPLVTLVGEQFTARNSYAFMKNVGLDIGIAYREPEYIEWGIKLGTDTNLRKQVIWQLTQSRQTSPLWQGEKFTRRMEQAYQQMWEAGPK